MNAGPNVRGLLRKASLFAGLIDPRVATEPVHARVLGGLRWPKMLPMPEPTV